MPAEAPRPERDEKHERILVSLMRLGRSPSAFKTAETREIVGDAYQWLLTVMCDLRGHETALSQAERRAEEAERLAEERLEALRRPINMQDVRLCVGEGKLSPLDIIVGCCLTMRSRANRTVSAALTAAAEGTGGASDAT